MPADYLAINGAKLSNIFENTKEIQQLTVKN